MNQDQCDTAKKIIIEVIEEWYNLGWKELNETKFNSIFKEAFYRCTDVLGEEEVNNKEFDNVFLDIFFKYYDYFERTGLYYAK